MEETPKKKRRLRDITFEKAGNHIALVGGVVGGPANGVETILWKSKATADISEEDVKQMLEKASGKTEVEKAKFYSETKTELRKKVEEKFGSKYDWLCIEDFSDTEVMFTTDAGMFVVGYTSTGDNEYTFDEKAIGVEYKSILVENGSVKLSAEAQEKLSEGTYILVSKSLKNPETNQRVVKAVGVTLEKAREKMEEEIVKAVAAANAVSQEKLAAVQADLVKAQDALAALAEEKKVTVMKARQASVEKFDKEGAEALVKATEGLDDGSFETLLKSLAVGRAAVEESILFKQASQHGTEETAQESATVTLLKKSAGK